MRGMLARGDSKPYWIAWLCFCFVFLFLCILPLFININARFYWFLMPTPFCLFAIVLYDFLNDFRVVRKAQVRSFSR
jgi:hypothetical protein